MDNLIGLVNRIQKACTALGDYGGDNAVASLWDSLPSVAVVGGQVCVSVFLSPTSQCLCQLEFLSFVLDILSGYSAAINKKC